MKKRVHKLILSDSNPYKLLGISSHENDYRLSWALNSKLGLNFRKTDNIHVQSSKKEGKLEFSVFKSAQEDKSLNMNLISNRCPNGFLITEMKNIDFFLQIFGEINQEEIDNITAKLKTIDIVSTVFEIIPGKLKKPGNLPTE